MKAEIRCKCGRLLSANGLTWGPGQGYRVSKRSDGTPIRGVVGRTDTKGSPIMCRSCCDEAVTAKQPLAREARQV